MVLPGLGQSPVCVLRAYFIGLPLPRTMGIVGWERALGSGSDHTLYLNQERTHFHFPWPRRQIVEDDEEEELVYFRHYRPNKYHTFVHCGVIFFKVVRGLWLMVPNQKYS